MSRRKEELKTVCALAGVCLALSAWSAVTTAVSQPFATATTDLTKLGSGTWAGYGSVTVGDNVPYTVPAAGKPITDATDKGVLNVEGYVTCEKALTSSEANVLVDMMVKVAVPDDDLEIPTDDAKDVQIAVGIDKSKKLNVYAKVANTAEWITLNEYEADAWIRVSFLFDYAAGRCQVRVNGEPQVSDSGYLTASGDTAGGSWYALVNNPAKFSSMKVVGSTSLDEVLVQHGTAAEVVSEYVLANANQTDSAGVKYSWYDQYGLAWDSTKTYDNSNLTLVQKYMTGLSPLDGSKFEITDMTMTADKATFTVPTMTDPAATITIESATDASFTTDTTSANVSGTTVSIDLPTDGKKRYYRLKATK